MQNLSIPKGKSQGIFLYLLILTGFFLLLEISFFIQCNRSYLSVFAFVSDRLELPASILPGVFFFILVELLLHLAYCSIIWLISLGLSRSLQSLKANVFLISIALWSIGIVTILISNQYYYPNSKFADLTNLFVSHEGSGFLLFVLLLFWSIIIVWILIRLYGRLFLLTFSTISVSILVFNQFHRDALINSGATAEKPNIFIVGIDSLRPDFIGYFGGRVETPSIDGFLERSATFGEAMTPLARTFPSWSAILTGKYPRESGIRTNLAVINPTHLENSLPEVLRKQGYETIYASDETRFSNISKQFGFDRILTPPMGLNDFLIGTFNDFPISNLLINSKIGAWLFPYSFANRPVFITYDPNSFINFLKPSLLKSHKKPLFLAIHFCLPHHPYLWSDSIVKENNIVARYRMSIGRVDQQLKDFFTLLRQAHLLDHAIVVLISDHGEALELSGDRITEAELFSPSVSSRDIPKFYPPSLDKEAINESVGHGTDVLGLSQYHSLMAIRLYGMGAYHSGTIPGVVTLLDIKPTVLDLLNIEKSQNSLVPLIRENKKLPQRQHIFLESDFSPEAIRTVYPETRKVMLDGIEIFQVNPISTLLTVRAEMEKKIIKSKQYADIHGHWILALYPQNTKYRMPILVNLDTGEWTNDLNSKFACSSPAQSMMTAMKTFYGDELG